MTKPFCYACTELRLGPAAVEASRRNAASAPPLTEEQRAYLRALFQSALPLPGEQVEPQRMACGHQPGERIYNSP